MKNKIITLLAKIRKHFNPLHLFKKWWKVKGIKKWLLLILVSIITLIICRQVLVTINRGKPNLKKYQITKVVKQDMRKIITKEGILRYAGVVEMPSPTSGIITDIWVKNGDEIKKGQKILRLQSTASKQDQAEAWSRYSAAISTLESAKITKMTSQVNLEAARQSVLEASQSRQNMDDRFAVGNKKNPSVNRPNQDYTDNEIEAIKSQETQARTKFTIAEQEYNTADLRVQAAQAAVNSSAWSYQLTKDSTIIAPISGRLTNLNFLKGETVNSQDGILFRIISSDDLVITLKVSEAEILHFQIDQTTEFKTAIYPDEKFIAKVISVDSLGTEIKNDSGSTMEYIVKIKPEKIDKKLLSPMTVDTDTIVEQKSSVLVVPNAAVSYSAGKRTVTIVKSGKTEIKEVVLGIISDETTEIISGLSEGDSILVQKVGKI